MLLLRLRRNYLNQNENCVIYQEIGEEIMDYDGVSAESFQYQPPQCYKPVCEGTEEGAAMIGFKHVYQNLTQEDCGVS